MALKHTMNGDGHHRIEADGEYDALIVVTPHQGWVPYAQPAFLNYNGEQYVAFTQYYFPHDNNQGFKPEVVYKLVELE